jgi:hypothetical protein
LNAILYLHFQARPDDPDEGATYERLLKLCLEREFCGPRVLRTVLMLAETTGRVAVQRGRFDRRLKIFRPTEKLLAQSRHSAERVLDSLELIVGDRWPRPSGSSRDVLIRRMTCVAGRRYFEDGIEICEHYEDLLAILRLDGGLATVIAVTDAELKGMNLPPYKEIAQRFRFSASQSRKILKRAEELGLVTFSSGGRLADASGLVRTYKWAIARELALHAKYALGMGPYFEQPLAERRAITKLEPVHDPFGASQVAGWEAAERLQHAEEARARS